MSGSLLQNIILEESYNMNIVYYENPSPHIVIDNFYSEKELDDIWKELNFLTNSRTLLTPDQTGSAKNPEGILIKSNSGVFLDKIFSFNRTVSHILTYNKKFFNEEFLNEVIPKNFIFRYISTSSKNNTLVSYYENSDDYSTHFDYSTLTACTWLYKKPKQFTGGDFFLDEFNYKIPIQNNRTIIFPSVLLHSVDSVAMNNKNNEQFSGNGRYVISTFINNTGDK